LEQTCINEYLAIPFEESAVCAFEEREATRAAVLVYRS
jgi:hypothetical protein